MEANDNDNTGMEPQSSGFYSPLLFGSMAVLFHYHLRHWEIRITLALGVWLVSESEVNESTSRFDEERRLNAPANGV